ncbi:ABC-F family ATP-binding cassette domain-containing protein [Actinophytocola gossypii]|uniref:ABC-F family ATP-binding cassette domain-containing protein n=1 Tax=Actinophytocola gossypii TaxID=2812003 RepID=A0ABT2J900_9PSEU|nr:ATP-binding cassette domain-containing protein [Actinophytocola gossypii]MCT2584253.1 ABC-F family ATP-binding cassette domain-containing protein [Actinophytocola gossypii]
MGHVEVSHLTQTLPDGRPLLDDVSFRVAAGVIAGVVGPNGAGKTTLLRLIAGDLTPTAGEVGTSGGVGVLRQFVATPTTTVRELLLSVAPARLRASTRALADAERALGDDEESQLAYAAAIAEHVDAGGYDIEVVWDTCTTIALGLPFDAAAGRPVGTLSGGERKRLVLATLLRGPDEVLLLDEPDNYLDVPGKEWLETELLACGKTVLLVSHDRALLANATSRVVAVEGRDVWVHGDGFGTFAQARAERVARVDARRRQWEDEHRRLRDVANTLRQKAARNDSVASAYKAARSRLARFEQAGPPRRPPKEQNVRMRLRGGRTGKRALTCTGLALTGLTEAFDLEVWFGERVAVLGANGTGKSRFLTLLAGGEVPNTGTVELGARVEPGHFVQTHTRPDLHGRTPAEVVVDGLGLDRDDGMSALARYEIAPAWNQPFETLSGGQQARLQILLLELTGATLLLLDEPTDNLDLASADALQHGLRAFTGTVLAITHDRWFAADFDRYLHFGPDGRVRETPAAVWR